MTPALYGNRKPEPSRGPTITCAIDFLDRSRDGQSFWIQDGGVPNLLADLAAAGEVNHPALDWVRNELLNRAPLFDVASSAFFRFCPDWFGGGEWENLCLVLGS